MLIKKMKALNIAQPNAHNVIFNGKNVENRSMITKKLGIIAIYGSKTYQKWRFENADVLKEECTFGAIIGFAELVGCITEEEVTKKTKYWFLGEYGWVLENPIALKEPILVSPPNGAIIWWDLKGAKLDKCLQQIPSAKLKKWKIAE